MSDKTFSHESSIFFRLGHTKLLVNCDFPNVAIGAQNSSLWCSVENCLSMKGENC